MLQKEHFVIVSGCSREKTDCVLSASGSEEKQAALGMNLSVDGVGPGSPHVACLVFHLIGYGEDLVVLGKAELGSYAVPCFGGVFGGSGGGGKVSDPAEIGAVGLEDLQVRFCRNGQRASQP